jgi:hypothetical protein
MDWHALVERFRSPVRYHTVGFSMPEIVMEIEPGFVAGARLDRAGGRVVMAAADEAESPRFQAAAGKPNFTDPEALRSALNTLGEKFGRGTSYLGLLVPDAAVRVGIYNFETLPKRAREADELIRWRMKDALPCDMDQARISYQMLSNNPGSIDLLVVAGSNSVLTEYESLLGGGNGGPGLILPATMALLTLVPHTNGAGHLLIHVCAGTVTTAVTVSDRIRMWRSREIREGGWIEDVCREAIRVAASSRDHLKVEISQVWLCVRPVPSAELKEQIARVLSCSVETLAPRPEAFATLTGADRVAFERYGITFAGLLANPQS